jgi:hypothetical protein
VAEVMNNKAFKSRMRPDPNCDGCREVETMEHLLYECTHYSQLLLIHLGEIITLQGECGILTPFEKTTSQKTPSIDTSKQFRHCVEAEMDVVSNFFINIGYSCFSEHYL